MNHHQANELLPCPFCGAPAQEKRNRTVMVACTKCTAATFQELADPSTAIAAWNRRAAPTEPAVDRDADDQIPVTRSTFGTKEACEAEHARRAGLAAPIPVGRDWVETLSELVSDFRKATYEFARGHDPEDHALMMERQGQIFALARSVAAPAAPAVPLVACVGCEGAPTLLNSPCGVCGESVHPAPPSPSVDQAKRSILVRITANDEGYEDVHPDLMMEDAMRVNPYGWPQGFSFEVLDQAKRLVGGEVAAPVGAAEFLAEYAAMGERAIASNSGSVKEIKHWLQDLAVIQRLQTVLAQSHRASTGSATSTSDGGGA